MTVASVQRAVVLFLVNHLYSGTRCFERKRKLLNTVGFSLAEGTRLVGPVFCTGTLTAGRNCWIGRNLTIHGNGAVLLGEGCDIGPDVTFLTGSHRIGGTERRAGPGQTDTIRVEDGCWIGGRATLLNPITIGKGSVVAACACVVKDVPENTLAGGVPARTIRIIHES